MREETLSRREALIFSGGTLVLAASGGLLHAADAAGRPLPEGDAYAPWHLWNDAALRQTPLALVSAAILAANPHDTQPWLFKVRADRIELLADLNRNLGAMDSYVREMHLGLGCAVENMLRAAPPNGFLCDLEMSDGSLLNLTKRSGLLPVATLKLTRRPVGPWDRLGRAIPARHTNRYPYMRDQPLPPDWLAFAQQAGTGADVRLFLFFDGPTRAYFDAAILEATGAIIADSTMIGDSDRWFRSSSAEIDAHRDGPTLDAAGLTFPTSLVARLLPLSAEMNHDGWRSQTRNQIASAPLTGLIAVRDRYDRRTALEAGRTWQRLQLAATASGVAMQPMNQPIEMIDRERRTGRGDKWGKRLARLTGGGWQATFSFRAGIASEDAPASPRRRLRDVVV